jgi:hypothetical protein
VPNGYSEAFDVTEALGMFLVDLNGALLSAYLTKSAGV